MGLKSLGKELFNHATSFPENLNYRKAVMRNTEKINGQTEVSQLAANLLEGCLDGTKIS